jgi:hypothetical protein
MGSQGMWWLRTKNAQRSEKQQHVESMMSKRKVRGSRSSPEKTEKLEICNQREERKNAIVTFANPVHSA